MQQRTERAARAGFAEFLSGWSIGLAMTLALSAVAAQGLAGPAWGQTVDVRPLPLRTVRAYPQVRLRRPVCITHAGDGSGRLFVVDEYGQVFILPKDPQGSEVKTFLDIEPKVDYEDKENEEGLLGLAFHPRFKENGQFFIYYTAKEPPHTSVIARMRVSASHPDQADPASEEVLLTIRQPYWNHNGGNLVFGPDGYLYIGLGDGGSANDPHGNGQNLKTLLGSILRIDVDRKDSGKAYAIPPDNPFVTHPEARPEIFAYGVRNIWGLSFDPATGRGWAADVGQNIWEEINLLEKGANYGWNLREGMHRFDVRRAQPGPGRSPAEQNRPEAHDRPGLTDPIWEYHHDADGKSITGGVVYRGKRLPVLEGHYVYADYVSGKIWGLLYDYQAERVVANRPIAGPTGFNIPCMAIGTDEAGEVYLGDSFGQLWTFEPAGDGS
jgi:quinoprotein glucose dehydrogenase